MSTGTSHLPQHSVTLLLSVARTGCRNVFGICLSRQSTVQASMLELVGPYHESSAPGFILSSSSWEHVYQPCLGASCGIGSNLASRSVPVLLPM